MSLITTFVISFAGSLPSGSAIAQASEAYPNGCNALRFAFGNNQASVANPCDAQGKISVADLAPIKEVVIEPTEEDYNAWVEFVRAKCSGGTNITTFEQIVDRTGTLFCRHTYQTSPFAFPPPAPRYFAGSLDFYQNQVLTSFDGFELVESLQSLNASRTYVNDISALSNVRSALDIDFSYADLTNLDGFQSLTTARNVRLNSNDITQVDGFSKLTEIESLDLSGNPLVNIDGLVGLRNLTSLRLPSTAIQSVDGLRNLESVSGVFDLSGGAFENLDGLSKLTSVGEFVLAGTKIKNVDGLANLTTVTNRILAWNNYDLENLDGFLGLTDVSLNLWRARSLIDVSGLQNISQGTISITAESRGVIEVRSPGESALCMAVLAGNVAITAGMYYYDLCDPIPSTDPEQLWLDYINIKCQRSTPFETMLETETGSVSCRYAPNPGNFPPPYPTKFKDFNFRWITMTDISGLGLLEEVTDTLSLAQTGLTDISALSNLRVVDYLSLEINNITDISPLKNIESVNTFYLHRNKIRTVPFIPAFTNIPYVDISSNEVHDLSELSALTSVQSFNLRGNNISSTRGLQNITSVGTLNLSSNPLIYLTGLMNIVSGTVHLGYLYEGNFEPLDDSTPFCQAIESGAVTLGPEISALINGGYSEVCVPFGAGSVGFMNIGEWLASNNSVLVGSLVGAKTIEPGGLCEVGEKYYKAWSTNNMTISASSSSSCTLFHPWGHNAQQPYYGAALTSSSSGSSGSTAEAGTFCYGVQEFTCSAGAEGAWSLTDTQNFLPANYVGLTLDPPTGSCYVGDTILRRTPDACQLDYSSGTPSISSCTIETYTCG